MNIENFIKTLIFIIPMALSGATNMVFMKTNLLNSLKKPMDGNLILWDGERLLGDNKTWKGFFGMIIITTFWYSLYGLLCYISDSILNYSYVPYDKLTLPFAEIICGLLLGIGYVVFELPNSFIKRRLKIKPGTNQKGFSGYMQVFFDQCDSVIGTIVFLLIIYIPSSAEIVLLFILGTGVHLLVNFLLYLAGLKKQAA